MRAAPSSSVGSKKAEAFETRKTPSGIPSKIRPWKSSTFSPADNPENALTKAEIVPSDIPLLVVQQKTVSLLNLQTLCPCLSNRTLLSLIALDPYRSSHYQPQSNIFDFLRRFPPLFVFSFFFPEMYGACLFPFQVPQWSRGPAGGRRGGPQARVGPADTRDNNALNLC